jgi:hypothetical protein
MGREMPQESIPDTALLRRWVETWRRAGVELEAVRRAEIQSVDTQKAIRQIFGTGDLPPLPPASPSSGLVEQQAWFARIHRARKNP